ncbi:DUF3040 domain-containing protein [Amycolatopsis sp. H20-H5]|uniref:DUF3040 domain-containing protein n=1 Tax=Amycolatopsis sp. H20-H5 TaxID=3046309 RepID=UPI002DC0428A|nr:DUF3040 domain-containing protein [Amycolatopsis sp. H20-H5]MEC3981640.1 DUF3040 domain-containing protein [Amycolatopsis sp. H20-H5]
MLPHNDRRELKKIEERMRASDPAFAETLDHGLDAGSAKTWKVLLVGADVTVVLMVVTGILTGDTTLFLWGLPAGFAVGWAHRSRGRNSRAT